MTKIQRKIVLEILEELLEDIKYYPEEGESFEEGFRSIVRKKLSENKNLNDQNT